jgi:hypothetical protein
MARRLAAAHVDVVSVKRDVERAERDIAARELRDQAAQALRQRNAARLNADERDAVEVMVLLDDLVRDPDDRAAKRLSVQQNLRALELRRQKRLLSGLTGPS